MKRWRAWRNRRRNRCRVSEEWGGLFIGRRYCSTHGYRWDPWERPCPGRSHAPESLPEGRWI